MILSFFLLPSVGMRWWRLRCNREADRGDSIFRVLRTGTTATRTQNGRFSVQHREYSQSFNSFDSEPLKMSATMNGSQSGTPLDFAWLFEMLPTSHFLLKTAALD